MPIVVRWREFVPGPVESTEIPDLYLRDPRTKLCYFSGRGGILATNKS